MLRVDTKLVQLETIVKDKKGNIVKDLTAQDFELIQDGKVTPIEFFSFVPVTLESSKDQPVTIKGIKASEVKRTLVFLVSSPNVKVTALINNRFVADIRTISYQRFSMDGINSSVRFLNRFINESLTPNDLVSINDTEANLGPLSNFTNDRGLLLAATDRLGSNLIKGRYATQNATLYLREGSTDWNVGDLIQQNLNTLAMADSAVDQLQKLPGRKLVFLLSRGMLGNSRLPGTDIVTQRLDRLIEKANRSGVTFYSLSLRTLGESNAPSYAIQGEDSMAHLAQKTGGRSIVNTNDLSVGLKEILQENSGYYQLAFSPEEGADSKAYQVQVRVRRPGLIVQHRSSVYQTNAIKEPTSASERILNLLRSPFSSDALRVQITGSFRPESKKTGTITSTVHIDPDVLKPLQNGKEIKLYLGIQVTEPDNYLARQEVKSFVLKPSDESWQRILKEGLNYQFDTPTSKEGSYLIKIAACLNDSDQCGNSEVLVRSN